MQAAVPVGRPVHASSSVELRLEYRGFRNTEASREYVFLARLLDDEREYVLKIAQTAFVARHVSFQDGPDLCFQRLRRELLGDALVPLPPLTITDVELAAYRTAHMPVATRRASPLLPRSPGSHGNPVQPAPSTERIR